MSLSTGIDPKTLNGDQLLSTLQRVEGVIKYNPLHGQIGLHGKDDRMIFQADGGMAMLAFVTLKERGAIQLVQNPPFELRADERYRCIGTDVKLQVYKAAEPDA